MTIVIALGIAMAVVVFVAVSYHRLNTAPEWYKPVALTPEQSEAAAFAEALGARYAEKTGIVPQIHICRASGGAHRLE